MRYWNAPEKADILVSELLGSFGGNELLPECFDGALSFLKPDGISIPSSYVNSFHSICYALSLLKIFFYFFVSLNGIEGGSVSSFPSSRDANHRVSLSTKELSTGYSANISEATRSSDVQHCDGSIIEVNEPVFLDNISSVDANSNKDEGILDNCGILPKNCLPCLASTIPSLVKRRSSCSSPPNARKKAPMKLSFKWREGHGNATPLFPSKTLLQRPIAGSQVPLCPIEKKMLDCWSHIGLSSFKVRGVNYFKDKKKDLASNYSAYYPFGVDVFLSPRKVDHIARFVELSVISSSGKFPPILVVNVQIPLYAATLFQGETDGEGMSFVLYFKLSEESECICEPTSN